MMSSKSTDIKPFRANPYRRMRGFHALSNKVRTEDELRVDTEKRKENVEKRKSRMSEFHAKKRGYFRDIVETNEACGIEIKESRTGEGLFNGSQNTIRGGVTLAYLIAVIDTVTYDSEFEKDRSYTWYEKWMGRDCVFNGRDSLETHRHPVNLSFVNHSCTPNCTVVRDRDFSTSVPFWVLRTLRDVLPGEQLSFDYGRGYFMSAKTVRNVPEQHIQRCGCALPDDCPFERAFDKRVIYESYESPGWFRRKRQEDAKLAEAAAALAI